jgi:hypothetical protein
LIGGGDSMLAGTGGRSKGHERHRDRQNENARCARET